LELGRIDTGRGRREVEAGVRGDVVDQVYTRRRRARLVVSKHAQKKPRRVEA
jgi:hypothetical protein